jgi:hypothetical protein
MVKKFTIAGRDLGKGYESSRALSFTPDGQVEMYLCFYTFDGYCHSHAFTCIKGVAVQKATYSTSRPGRVSSGVSTEACVAVAATILPAR